MLTRRWARRGSRPTALRDQRTKSAYIFGAICPARGVGAGLVLPRCNTQAMQWHLDEISALVTPGAHAVLIIDRAGWHTTGRLEIPSNITLMFLPPRAPELNPVENIWQFMRDNWLSNRIFKTYDDNDAPVVPVNEAAGKIIQECEGLVILLAKHIFRIGCSVLHTLNDITAHNNEIRWCYLRVLLGRVVISVSFQRFK